MKIFVAGDENIPGFLFVASIGQEKDVEVTNDTKLEISAQVLLGLNISLNLSEIKNFIETLFK